MGRILSGAMAASLVVALAAGCSSENKDNVFSQGDDDREESPTDGGGSGDLGGQGQAYVDAIATVGQFDDPDDDSDLPLSEGAAVCYGEAYVEVIGVERLADKVTPDELEANPDKDSADWGLEVSKDEGAEIFRGLIDCEPGVLQEMGTKLADQMSEGDAAGAFDADCLAEVDPDDIDEVMGASIAGGDDYVPNEEEATAMVDWLMGCGDMRAVILSAFEAEGTFPDSAIECIDEGLDDELIRGMLIASMALGDDAEPEDTPQGTEFLEIVTDCMAG